METMNQKEKDLKFLKKACPNAITIYSNSVKDRAYSLTFDNPTIVLACLKDKFYVKCISPSLDDKPDHIDIFVQALD